MRQKKGETFQTNQLAGFQFGDPDAKFDELLLNCPQTIRGVREFLSGSKNIVLGERGVGKSALFRLVNEGKYKFASEKTEKNRRHLIVGIDEDLNYVAITNFVESRFIDHAKRPHGKYLFLWEIYILSRVIEKLVDEFGYEVEIQTLQEDFNEVLGVSRDRRFRLGDILTSFKVSTGIKVDQAGSFSPTFSIEPAKDAAQSVEVTDFQIGQFRTRVRKAIRARRAVVYVLIDKIDDFLVGLAYSEQKKSVQALLECTQALRFPELKLKLFMRVDLFKRLNFEKGGYDKIAPQVVRLEWTADDIYGFVARRLLFNYERQQIRTPSWGVSLDILDFDPLINQQVREMLVRRSIGASEKIRKLYSALILSCKMTWAKYRKRSHSERKTNSLDAILSKIVTYIFPTKVLHLTQICRKDEILFKTFINDHFKLGSDCANPRLILLFLSYTLEEAVEYYERNPDQACRELEPNEIGEYELILKEHVLRGYRKLQINARENAILLNDRWRGPIGRLLAGLTTPKQCIGLSIEDIHSKSAWDYDHEEFKNFIAFFSHIGVLVVENEAANFNDRHFSLPIVMRMCPA